LKPCSPKVCFQVNLRGLAPRAFHAVTRIFLPGSTISGSALENHSSLLEQIFFRISCSF